MKFLLFLAVTLNPNIGCSPGTIELTASGGFVDPNYSYATWSKDGTPLYSDISNVPQMLIKIDPIFEFWLYRIRRPNRSRSFSHLFVYIKYQNWRKVYNTFVGYRRQTACYKISNARNSWRSRKYDNFLWWDSPNNPVIAQVSCKRLLSIRKWLRSFSIHINNGLTFQDSPFLCWLAAGTYTVPGM